MKQMLILVVSTWLGVSAAAHAQVNSATNAASTVTGAIEPSGQGVTGVAGGGSGAGPAPVAVTCPFGVSLSADLTAFGCASDPLGTPINQISAEAGAVITGPVGNTRAVNAQTVTPNATSGAGGAGGGVSSSASCLGGAGSVGAGQLLGRGGC
jgi:hypothetical protein